MARRGKKKKAWRFQRSFFSLLSLVLAMAGGYVAGRESGPSPDRDVVFASFAELDVDLESVRRMRASPVPPRKKPAREPWTAIAAVMDGDTLRLADGRTVRLIGIDAPESSDNKKLRRDMETMGVKFRPSDLTALGGDATAYARTLAEGRRCWLEYDRERTDLYGRTLAYVHLDTGVTLNEAMISGGFAKVYLNNSFLYKRRYIMLQIEARMRRRGLWKPSADSLDNEHLALRE